MTAPIGFFWWPKGNIRGKPQRIVSAERWGLSSTACPGNFVLVKNIRPSLCLVTIWLLTSVQKLLCPLFILSQLSLWASQLGPARLPPWSEAIIQEGSCFCGAEGQPRTPSDLSGEPWSLTHCCLVIQHPSCFWKLHIQPGKINKGHCSPMRLFITLFF